MYEKELLKPTEVAERLKVHKETVLNMIKRNDLQAIRIGPKTIRIPVSSLNHYLHQNTK